MKTPEAKNLSVYFVEIPGCESCYSENLVILFKIREGIFHVKHLEKSYRLMVCAFS